MSGEIVFAESSKFVIVVDDEPLTLIVPPQGPRGLKGDKGDKGDQGDAGTVAIGTVSTGAPGSAATVINVGTPEVAVLNISIPRGDVGPPNVGYAASSAQSKACVNTGTVAFSDVAAGLDYQAGDRARATSVGTGEFMEGVVSSYSGTSLAIIMDYRSGTGTHTDWHIGLAGQPGIPGTGDVSHTRQILTAGLATGGGDLSADRTITVPKAAGTDVTTGTDDAKAVTPKALADAGIAAGGGFSTGDVKLTFKTTADTGWYMLNDTSIGDASSGASHANPDAQALFTLFFNNLTDTAAPIQTSSGSATTRAAQTDAATAWAAHCRIVTPKVLGRALGVAGTGSGLTSRALGATVGEETHTLTAAEQASMSVSGTTNAVFQGGLFGGPFTAGGDSSAPTGSISGTAAGGGGAHNTMQPTTFLNVEVKL